MATLPFLYQLQGVTYISLSAQSFRVAVVDMDESGLTASQLQSLHNQNKTVYTYLSIGEAEDYRDYWIDGHWSQQKPSFVLGENPDWPGNYSVKFWDYTWQQIMFGRVADAIAHGYDGMYLDIVDAYQVAQVRNAYTGPDIRQAMVDFVVALSQYAKALDPDFKVIPQNAVGLLALTESNPNLPNAAYLNAIDGIGVEDLWYDGNSTASWTAGDLAFIKNAVNAGKFVLATSYPTQDAKQEAFVTNALNAGLIPFVADRNLTGVVDATDLTIDARMAGRDINTPWNQSSAVGNPHVPIATGDSYHVAHDSPLVVSKALGLLANDHDPDGDTLHAVLVDGPDHGALTFNADGSFSYSPVAGYGGLDSFTYKAADAATFSQIVTVQLDVAPLVVPGTPNSDLLTGSGGNDLLLGGAGADHLYGLKGDDRLDGGLGNDILAGGDGADILTGGNGNDELLGGNGNDKLLGQSGNDRLEGGNGNDRLDGGAGKDRLAGGAGADSLTGDDGNDRLYGQAGHDRLNGGDGNDHLDGGTGNDVLVGQNGADKAFGGLGNDLINGGKGDDYLDGGAGNDVVAGGLGNDVIIGGPGNDTLNGGPGSDLFIFSSVGDVGMLGSGDVIQDFNLALDRLDLSRIDADALTTGDQAFILLPADAPFSAPGQLQVSHVLLGGTEHTLVQGNVDANLAPDFQLDFLGNIALTSGSMIL
jgi:uncharacterized protein (TIGR01370 family)